MKLAQMTPHLLAELDHFLLTFIKTPYLDPKPWHTLLEQGQSCEPQALAKGTTPHTNHPLEIHWHASDNRLEVWLGSNQFTLEMRAIATLPPHLSLQTTLASLTPHLPNFGWESHAELLVPLRSLSTSWSYILNDTPSSLEDVLHGQSPHDPILQEQLAAEQLHLMEPWLSQDARMLHGVVQDYFLAETWTLAIPPLLAYIDTLQKPTTMWHMLGFAYAKSHRPYQAQQAYQKALDVYQAQTEEDPEDPHAWFWGAGVAAQMGELKQSRAWLDQALRLEPSYQATFEEEEDFAPLRESKGG